MMTAKFAELSWLSDPEVFAVNRKAAHSDHDYYTSMEEAKQWGKMNLRQSLNGNWLFSYAEKPADRKADFYKEDYDCSGFATYVINTVMQKYAPAYRVTPQTGSMWNAYDILNTGLKGEFRAIDVAWEDARLGDVVFFKSATTGELNHCGLYMGNNEFLHCTEAWEKGENPTTSDVGLMTLNSTYGDLVIGFKRFIPETVEPANAAFYAAKDCNIYSDCRCKEQVDLGLSAGDAVTVLYTRPTTNNTVAYIRTADDRFGFVWMSNLSAAE